MPKVDEERVRQAEVDSRCYELTVLPLADVTQAYDERELVDGERRILSRSVKVRSSSPASYERAY